MRFTSLLALICVLALSAPADSGAVPAGQARQKQVQSKEARKKQRARKRAKRRQAAKRKHRRRPATGTSQPAPVTQPSSEQGVGSAPAPDQTTGSQPTSDSGSTSGSGSGSGSGSPSSTPTPTATPSPSITRPFAPTSFWNAPLAADAPLDAKSDVYVGRLHTLLQAFDPYVNTTRFSSPVYTVPADQPTVKVKLDQDNPALQAAFEAVPIPDGAQPAAGTDGTMIVWQPETDTMWEFWIARHVANGWHAMYGGKMTNVSTNPGHYLPPHERWGATATSIPFLGGLMRLDELAAGRLDHALAIALPETRNNAYSWPAQRSDGLLVDADAIPEGARFRIDPKLDLNKVKMAPIVRLMAQAAQRYGMVVRDGGGSIAFYGEDPTPTGKNPYAGPQGFFNGGYINQMLREQFPWDHLQVLKTQMSYGR